MSDKKGNEWDELKDKHFLIEEISGENNASIIFEAFITGVKIEGEDLQDIKFREKRNKSERWSKKPEWTIKRPLNEREIIDFEVADYIKGIKPIPDNFESISREKCKYMQKSAEIETQRYSPNKPIVILILGIIYTITSEMQPITLYNVPTENPEIIIPKIIIPLWGILFTALISWLFFKYQGHNNRFHELTLRLEARILLEF